MEALDLSHQFAGCYAGRRVLVTGHTGFKGSWLAAWLDALGARVAGLALDPDTTPSHWQLLDLRLEHDARVDLRDAQGVRAVFDAFAPEVVFHLAAQPLVRRGYREPTLTFDTNVIGLVNVLEAVRACPPMRAVVNATTDKVYAPAAQPRAYVESDPLGGHDPYSTSKACAELVSDCYRSSYFQGDDGVRLATARAGNVVGGGDWSEDRLVPDVVRAVQSGQPVHLRNPDATRPWQHVLEPLSGYLRIGQRLLDGTLAGGAWNLGPSADASLAVGEVVARLQRAWPQLQVRHDRGEHPHEAPLLALDSARAMGALGWRPVWDASTTLARTADWYRAFAAGGGVRTRDDLAAFAGDARRAGLAWA